jgi:hypothetical protein
MPTMLTIVNLLSCRLPCHQGETRESTAFSLTANCARPNLPTPPDDSPFFPSPADFAIYARSDVFLAKSRIARHRLVNDALKDEFARGLHALSLKLETEEEGAGK